MSTVTLHVSRHDSIQSVARYPQCVAIQCVARPTKSSNVLLALANHFFDARVFVSVWYVLFA